MRSSRRAKLRRLLVAWALALGGCSETEPGIELPVQIEVNAGTAEVIERLSLALRGFELERCAGEARRTSPGLSPWRWALVRTAWAHDQGGHTLIAVAGPLSIVPAASVPPATFRPPPGRYCAVRLLLGPAGAPTAELTARGPAGPFVVRTALLPVLVLPAPGGDLRLQRREDGRPITVVFDLRRAPLPDGLAANDDAAALAFGAWLQAITSWR